VEVVSEIGVSAVIHGRALDTSWVRWNISVVTCKFSVGVLGLLSYLGGYLIIQ